MTDMRAARLADLCVQALIDEVTLTPKPGLVDIRHRGAHHDLNWALMCRSALALRPTFARLAHAAIHADTDLRLRETLGRIGREGEAAMLAATGGINTHRGAIWALGLLVAAAARHPGSNADTLAHAAGALARLPDRHAPRQTGNKGEMACQRYGVGGARAQAQAGFPQIVRVALPALNESRRQGHSEAAARLNALLAVMAGLDDTCLLSRGGPEALRRVQRGAAAVLHAGGAGSWRGRIALRALDQCMLARHLSPGGAADLLAGALFLDALTSSGTLMPNPSNREIQTCRN